MGKKVWILFAIIIIFIAGGLFYFFKPDKNIDMINVPTVNITYENFASVLQGNSIVRDLPSDAVLVVQFYNFNSGSREIEKSFVMKKNNVYEGNEKADITIQIHSKYLKELTNKNFCTIVQKAKENGDMGTETELSATSLAWKFKSMLKYRECLGF